jgi:NADH pyrophosphatase NudC (nudix superfamily)
MPEPRFCLHCGATLEQRLVDGESRAACTACSFVHFDNPVAVAGVIVRRGTKVLLVRQPRGEQFALVAGFLEAFESAEDAAVREVKEETGLDVEIVRFMGTHAYGSRPDQIVIAFHVRVLSGELCAQDDIDEAEFGPPDPSRMRPGSTSHWLVSQLVEQT